MRPEEFRIVIVTPCCPARTSQAMDKYDIKGWRGLWFIEDCKSLRIFGAVKLHYS